MTFQVDSLRQAILLIKHLLNEHDQKTHNWRDSQAKTIESMSAWKKKLNVSEGAQRTPTIIYHGTYERFVKDIKRYGLTSSKSKKRRNWDTLFFFGKDRAKKIFLTPNLSDAIFYAKRALNTRTIKTPKRSKKAVVVLRIEIPKAIKLEKDKKSSGDFMIDKVRPEWIKSVGYFDQVTGKLREEKSSVYFYISIVLELIDIEQKHLLGHHDQKDHGRKTTSYVPENITVDRHDTEADWQSVGLRRITDDEVKEAFIIDDIDNAHVTITSDDDMIAVLAISGVEQGEPPVRIMREIYKGVYGPEIAHTGFRLPLNLQKKGIGSDLLERAEKIYKKVGIKRIVLEANSTVGSYAWARLGFDFLGKDTRLRMVGEFYKELSNRGIKDRPDIQHSWDLALWRGGGYSGKEFLLKKQVAYDAVKMLDDSDEGYKVGQLYYKLRKNR